MRETQLWSGLSLVGRLGARVNGVLPLGVSGISIDSRSLVPGDLFFAIKGEGSDGHAYVGKAVANGAAAAVIDEAHVAACRDMPCCFIVRDVLAALERLGRAARSRSGARIVGVTGSVGKTSTKEALRQVLSQAGATHASIASYNNQWGVPLTLARMPAAVRYGVFEIGMNHAGEIRGLVDQVRPHVAIITHVGPVHLEHFSSVEDIADAKAEIFSGLVNGGVAIIQCDIDTYPRLRSAAEASPAGRIVTFGAADRADARLEAVEPWEGGSRILATIHGQSMEYRLASPGRHLAMNSLAVLLAAEALGIELTLAAEALAGVRPELGRGARQRLSAKDGDFTLIDESYNANPVSMRAALALLGSAEPEGDGRRIAVLGDMLELGPESARLHEDLAEDILSQGVDLLFAAGSFSRGLFDRMPSDRQGLWVPAAADLVAPLAQAIRPGDVLMVKGSKGSHMTPLVESLRKRFGASADEPLEPGRPAPLALAPAPKAPDSAASAEPASVAPPAALAS